jgi:hypothetical protein
MLEMYMNLSLFVLTRFALFLFSVALVISGFAESSFAQKVRLRAQITPTCATTSNLKFADIYADGNIAVQGSYNCRGAFIYDISNPDNPVLSSWYNPGSNQQFLEAIVIGNRGYFGSGNGGGVHIVDLTNPASPSLLGTVNSSQGNGHNSIHEMVVIQQNGQSILVENFNGFSNKIIKFINVTNPASPVFIRDLNPTEAIWVHAMHFRGNRMFTSGWGSSSNRGRTEIYDVSNVATQAPTLLGFIEDQTTTTAGNSMHSSWSSEDGNYLYSCRETSNGSGDVRAYDITNPAQPLLVKSIGMNALGLNAVTPHNPVVFGNYLYVAWYQAGLQVFDISNPSDPKRVGQYDTFQPVFAPPLEEKLNAMAAEPWDMICGSENLQNLLPTSYDGNWAVFPLLGQDKVLLGDLANGLIVVDATGVAAVPKNQVSDFDGDGKTDFSTFTPNTNSWNIESSSNGSYSQTPFGVAGDKLEPGDYDGDGISDIAIYRPSTGTWWIRRSSNPSNFVAINFGLSTDVPVSGDYDADGKTDVAVWRPSTGVWYIQQSSLGLRIVQWGLNGDKAFSGDYDGDGKADMVIYRNGAWYILQSSSSLAIIANFGLSTDKPVVGNFDNDDKYDFAVYRPSEGNWYILKSSDNSVLVNRFGALDDVPISADYDGDGKCDIAVFRPSDNVWYRLNSSNGAFSARAFGQIGDLPSPASVNP